MLYEHFAAILGLVIVNVLVINCAISEQNYENLKETIPADVHFYNFDLNDKGPVLPKIFEQNPRLAFLGAFNGKNWYIERTLATHSESIHGCNLMGMRLAEPNQAELNFLYSVTTPSDDRAWLGGMITIQLDCFSWLSDRSKPINTTFVYNAGFNIALSFVRLWDYGGLFENLTHNNHYYICSIP